MRNSIQNSVRRNLNGYVLSPFGDVDMNDPSYGWGGGGDSSAPTSSAVVMPGTPSTTSPSFLERAGDTVLGLFTGSSRLPTANVNVSLNEEQLRQVRSSTENLPLYLGLGAGAVLLFLLLKK